LWWGLPGQEQKNGVSECGREGAWGRWRVAIERDRLGRQGERWVTGTAPPSIGGSKTPLIV